jgi:hypothetical protein
MLAVREADRFGPTSPVASESAWLLCTVVKAAQEARSVDRAGVSGLRSRLSMSGCTVRGNCEGRGFEFRHLNTWGCSSAGRASL